MLFAGCASSEACGDCIVGCLEPKSWQAKADGWGERSRHTVELSAVRDSPEALVRVAEFRPYPNLTYRFVGCGGPGFHDLDVLVYDANDTLLARDSSRGRDPEVEVAGDTAPHLRVRLFAAQLDTDRDSAGLLILAR